MDDLSDVRNATNWPQPSHCQTGGLAEAGPRREHCRTWYDHSTLFTSVGGDMKERNIRRKKKKKTAVRPMTMETQV